MNDSPLNVSRHLPIVLSLDLHAESTDIPPGSPFEKVSYRWDIKDDTDKYSSTLSTCLENCHFEFRNLDESYDKLVRCLTTSSTESLKQKRFNAFLKPYWSRVLKEHHEEQRRSRLHWKSLGKPRHGRHYDEYKSKKRKFRKLLRNAATKFEFEEADRFDALSESDQKAVWKTVNSRKPRKKSQGSEI